MEFDMEIYRGESRHYFCELEFALVLRKAARRHFGDLATRGQLELLLDESPDEDTYPGPPQVHNLTSRFGRCSISLIHDGETVRREGMRVVDLFGPVLADELRAMRPDEAHWWFRLRKRRRSAIIILGGDQLTGEVRPAPESKGSVDVDPNEPRHRPFTLTAMAATEAVPVRPEDLGLPADKLGKITVLMSGAIHKDFLRRMPLSDRMEEGGFLLGRVTQADEASHLVEITHVTPAHRSGAGAVHFTFTGESFLAAAQLIKERGHGEQLVGWYHTHLFGVSHDLGLSSIDVDLHLATFQQSWQVAALINIRPDQRVLRIYGRDEKTLREYDQWISDDSGTYRPADRALGG